MAFPTGWGYKQKLTIQNGQVSGTLTDFPVLITRTELHSDVVDPSGSNNAQANGGDIRFSSDAAGTTQIACEVVAFAHDTTTGAGDAVIEVWVDLASISSSVDTDFYIWYNTTGSDSQPAVSATYGRDAVWSNGFDAVFHMQETTGDFINSVGDGDDAVMPGATTGITRGASGAFGEGCIDLASTQNPIEPGSPDPGYWHDSFSNSTISAWATRGATDAGGPNVIVDDGGNTNGQSLSYRNSPNTLHYNTNVGSTNEELDSTSTFSESSAFFLIHGTYDAGTTKLYVNASNEASGSNGTSVAAHTDGPGIGDLVSTGANANTMTAWSGKIDELRRSNVARNGDWITAEYNNQNAPSTFIVDGTPEATAGNIITANQSESGDTQSASITSPRNITASQTEEGDAQVAAISVVAQISANQSESGDITTAAIQNIAQVSANQTEEGDTQAASIVGVVTASISANQNEEGDTTAAALEVLAQINANQSEVGDTQVAALSTSVIANIAANQSEAGDITAAALVTLRQITANQAEAGDSQNVSLQVLVQIIANQLEAGDATIAAISSGEAPTVPGFEYTLGERRFHYTALNRKFHYTAPGGKFHYTA